MEHQHKAYLNGKSIHLPGRGRGMGAVLLGSQGNASSYSSIDDYVNTTHKNPCWKRLSGY